MITALIVLGFFMAGFVIVLLLYIGDLLHDILKELRKESRR